MSGKGQLGFAEAFVSPRLGSNRKLERLDGLIDWSALEHLASQVRPGGSGPSALCALVDVEGAVFAGALRSVGSRSGGGAAGPPVVPALLRLCARRGDADATTICRFRADAGAALEAAFEAINAQLDAAGLILRKGTLMDATLVAAASRPPPYTAGAGARAPREPGADWTRKQGRAFFGYKAHLGVDQGSGLIRRVVLSSAKTYESQVADRLICGDEAAVYGDRAYEQAQTGAAQGRRHQDRIMHRRNKHRAALPPWQKRRNDLIARRRAPVEAVFSALKRFYGLRRARSPSLDGNTARPLRRSRRLQYAPGLPARRTVRPWRARKTAKYANARPGSAVSNTPIDTQSRRKIPGPLPTKPSPGISQRNPVGEGVRGRGTASTASPLSQNNPLQRGRDKAAKPQIEAPPGVPSLSIQVPFETPRT